MVWFFETFHDYDYYKYITQPLFIKESILNFYKAKGKVKQNGG